MTEEPGERLVRVGATRAVTRAEGPGVRHAVWVQGCSIRCPGCCNPHLFDASAGEPIEVAALLAEIARHRGSIEGITVLGGEPFEQVRGVEALARGARAMGLTVMVFSGYSLDDLRARDDAAGLLDAIDVLVDGPFIASEPERERLWAGSRNQRFHYLSDRYGPHIERPAAGAARETIEVELGADGAVRINGWPALVRLARGGVS